jgi:hypothetical protein
MSLDLDTRLELIKLYYANNECATSTLRAYKTRHELHNDPFPLSTITRLVHKFETTKSLHDAPKSGRNSLFEEREEVIMESLQSIQSSSHLGVACSSSISQDTGIPARSVRRYLREYLGMYPYHLTTTQEITESDKVHRLEFAQWLLQNHKLIPHILWSDEAYFAKMISMSLSSTFSLHLQLGMDLHIPTEIVEICKISTVWFYLSCPTVYWKKRAANHK